MFLRGYHGYLFASIENKRDRIVIGGVSGASINLTDVTTLFIILLKHVLQFIDMNNKKQVKTQDKQGVRCLKTTSFKLFFFSRITGVVSFSFRIALLSILCRIFFCFPLLYVVLCIEHILCDFFLSHEQTHQNTYTNSHPRHQAFFSYISSFSIHTHTHRETPI